MASNSKTGPALLFIVLVLGAATASTGAPAITAELAKKCRALAIKAHPYKLAGAKGPGSAQAEREYFKECVARGGDMPDENKEPPPANPPK